MADISTWSPTDESNTAAPPAGAPENMQPSAVNNTMRAMMGAIRRWYDTVTAQLASITTSLGNYLPLTGGTLSGTLSAPQYNLSGAIFAGSDGTTTTIYDPTGTHGFHLQAATNYYDANGHVFRDSSGSLSTAILDSAGNVTIAGSYIHFQGSGGAVNTTGGPLLFADNNNHIYKQGPGNGLFAFQNYAGTNVAYIDSNGIITAPAFVGNVTVPANGPVSTGGTVTGGTVTGGTVTSTGNVTASGSVSGANVTAASAVTGAYIHSTANIQADGAFTGGSVSVSGAVTAPGGVYTTLLRGGNGNDSGVLYTAPTASPTRHTLAFGWDDVSSVFYKITDNSRTDTIPWSDTIRALILAADGGTPSGWHLSVFSGGTTFAIYVDFTASDARMKRGIADSEIDALAALCSVPVRKFEWLDEVQETFGVRQGPVAIGLVAQDVLPHMPDVVGISEGRGAPYPEDTHTLMYDRIHAYTIRAIQQLAAENAALTARVAALEEASHV